MVERPVVTLLDGPLGKTRFNPREHAQQTNAALTRRPVAVRQHLFDRSCHEPGAERSSASDELRDHSRY